MNYEYIYMPSVDSSNNEAKRRIADGTLKKATLIVAGEQTAGRGRQGKSFYSPAETGLYMTLTVPLDCPISGQVTLTTAVAVAVASTIEETYGIVPSIKWVNDIYVEDKKCCGILCEAINDYELGIMKYAVIGVGINVTTVNWPDEVRNIAGSVLGDDPNGRYIPANENDPGKLASGVARNILCRLEKLGEAEYLDYYRSHSNVIGRELNFTEDGRQYEATAIDVNETGALLVELSNGERRLLNSGEISVRVKNK